MLENWHDRHHKDSKYRTMLPPIIIGMLLIWIIPEIIPILLDTSVLESYLIIWLGRIFITLMLVAVLIL